MRVSGNVFLGGLFFFAPLAVIYGFWTNWGEWVGIIGIFLLGGMSAMVGIYIRATSKRHDLDPADNPAGVVSDSAGDYGFFSPHSWWPLPVGIGAVLIFLGLAVGWWIFVLGIVVGLVAIIGWTFEYFRGDVI